MTTPIETLTQIAKDHLSIDTLLPRNSDEADFHDCSVWQLQKALQAAYNAGIIAAAKPKRIFKHKKGVGTSYKAAVKTTLKDLTEIWGNPQQGADDKIEAEWIFELPHGETMTIYNYKNSRKYHSTYPPIEKVQRWHIGGNDRNVVHIFMAAMASRAEIVDAA